MTEEDLAQTLLDYQAKLIAHEDIMRALVLKVAREHALTAELQLEWVKELQEVVLENRIALLGKAKYSSDMVALDKDVTKMVDLFFRPFK